MSCLSLGSVDNPTFWNRFVGMLVSYKSDSVMLCHRLFAGTQAISWSFESLGGIRKGKKTENLFVPRKKNSLWTEFYEFIRQTKSPSSICVLNVCRCCFLGSRGSYCCSYRRNALGRSSEIGKWTDSLSWDWRNTHCSVHVPCLLSCAQR